MTVIEEQVAFVPDDAWDMLGLPRSDASVDAATKLSAPALIEAAAEGAELGTSDEDA